MNELLYVVYLSAVLERGAWVRTINTLVSHGMTPRQIVVFLTQLTNESEATG